MSFRLTWLVLGALAGLSSVPSGRIRHVPAEYRTIQAAIDSAEPGDTVLVAPGRYVENIRVGGKGIVVASEYLKHPDSASVVMIVEQEDTSAKLSGFTLTGGTGMVWTDARQKALYREGGGVLCELASPVIEHNIIEGNEAVQVGPGGAGIALYHSAGTARNNLVTGNTGGAGHGGSGLWVVGALSYRLQNLIEQNTIVGNVTMLPDSTPTQLGGKGGGLIAFAPMLFRNNIVWDNRQGVGGQIEQSKRQPPDLRANLVQDGAAPGVSLTPNPKFTDTVHYYLSPDSPAVDAGDVGSPPDPAASARARAPAMGARRPDLGAYGGPGSAVLLP